MGYYENIRCHKCKYSFTDGFTSSNGIMKTKVGVPAIICPKCNTVNITRWVPYSILTTGEKIYHWTSIYLRYNFYGFAIGLIVAGLLNKFVLTKTQLVDLTFIFIVIIAMVAANFYAFKTEWKDIELVETEYQRLIKEQIIKHKKS